MYARDNFMVRMGESIERIQRLINDAVMYMKDLTSLLKDPKNIDW